MNYKDLCINTEDVLKKFKMNWQNKIKDSFNKKRTTEKLNYSTGQKVSDKDYKLLKNEMKSMIKLNEMNFISKSPRGTIFATPGG